MSLEDIKNNLGGLDPLDGPIPGESLTSNPEVRQPFEKPPAHTDLEEAVESLFNRMIDEEKLDQILDLMRRGLPVEDIAQVVLFTGFREGQWTPDLMLTMIEPTIYILLALAEYAGIEAELYPEEDMDEDEDEDYSGELEKALSFGDAVKSGPEEEGETMEGNTFQGVKRPAVVSDSILDRIKQTAPEA